MARPRNYDHEQIAEMARQGIPDKIIARRLGCTRRTVQRVRSRRGLDAHPDSPLWGSMLEHLLWKHDKDWGNSYREVAWRFGVSHERVRQAIQNLEWRGQPARRPAHLEAPDQEPAAA